MYIHSPIACPTLRDEEPIAQLWYWLNSYSKFNIPPKALPLLMCAKHTALRDMFRDKYSTRLHLVLYLSLDTLPHAVFSIQTRGSALSNINRIAIQYITMLYMKQPKKLIVLLVSVTIIWWSRVRISICIAILCLKVEWKQFCQLLFYVKKIWLYSTVT